MANKILRLRTDLTFEEIEVSSKVVQYKELRNAVGNWIEHVTFNRELDENGIDVWCDEEYRIKNSKPTVVVIDDNRKTIDWLGGNLVFTAKSRNYDGESYSLSEEQIIIIKYVLSRKAYLNSGDLVRLMDWK